jgi:hypothetical protein
LDQSLSYSSAIKAGATTRESEIVATPPEPGFYDGADCASNVAAAMNRNGDDKCGCFFFDLTSNTTGIAVVEAYNLK